MIILPVFDFFTFLELFVFDWVTSPPPMENLRSLKRMLKALAPMVEKLSLRLLFIASIAVIIPTRAIIPNAMMATVMPVLSLFPLIVLQANIKLSVIFMT